MAPPVWASTPSPCCWRCATTSATTTRLSTKAKWANHIDWCYWDHPLIELDGKTAGIIGFGRIGQTTGRIAKALGMKVLAYDLYPNDSGKAIAEYVDLDTLLAQSDVVFLHCNLTADNEKMINKASIAKMKDGAILINNSRGQLIDEQDVTDAPESGQAGGRRPGCSVHRAHPCGQPLLTAPNCIITPHMSWGAKEARQRIMDCTADNIRAYLDGEPIHVVNPLREGSKQLNTAPGPIPCGARGCVLV